MTARDRHTAISGATFGEHFDACSLPERTAWEKSSKHVEDAQQRILGDFRQAASLLPPSGMKRAGGGCFSA